MSEWYIDPPGPGWHGKALTPSGAKAHQRADSEDRAKEYRDWHRSLDRAYMAQDVDHIEWRWGVNGELVPVAVIELTRVDRGMIVNDRYLEAILARFERDIQGRAARRVAEALGVRAFVVLFRQGLGEFWVYNLTDRRGWFRVGQAKYIEFLESL